MRQTSTKETEIYRFFFEEARDACFHTSTDEKILKFNKAFTELLGYLPEDAPLLELVDIYECIDDKHEGVTETRLKAKDGTVKECRVVVLPRNDSKGRLRGYICMIRDISSARRVRECLEKKTRDLSARVRYLDCLYEIYSIIDRKGFSFDETVQGIVDLVPQAMDYMDIACSRVQLNGKEYVSPNFCQTPWVLRGEIVTMCHVVGYLEIYYLEERPASFDGPFAEAEKRLVDIVASRLGRIFARKRAEEMLSESEQRYRSLFEDSRDAIYTTSRDGILLDVNRAGLELCGYSAEEIVGMNVSMIYEQKSGRRAFQQKIEDRGAVRDYEVRLLKKSGQPMDCLFTSSVRKDAQGRIIGYHCIIRDITERKRAEEERRKLIDELSAAIEKIHTLKGLIPICANCKKIRDDSGYWNQLEKYIEAHSDAVFSHGLCPECQKRFEEE